MNLVAPQMVHCYWQTNTDRFVAMTVGIRELLLIPFRQNVRHEHGGDGINADQQADNEQNGLLAKRRQPFCFVVVCSAPIVALELEVNEWLCRIGHERDHQHH